MEFKEYYCKKIAVIAADLFAVVLILCGVWGGIGGTAAGVFFYVAKAVICTILAVRILWMNHGGAIAESGVNFLLWPRRFLKKAPPPLSKAQALMLRGEWEQAQFLLKNWHREYPGSANIALDLFGLLADHFQRYDEALQTACETLESSCRIREEAAVPLLGRVTDLLCAAGHQEKAVELLRREAERSSLYAPEQLRNIKQRENALRKEL